MRDPDHLDSLQLIGDWLDAHALAFPGRAALEFAGLQLTYGQLQAHVDACAKAYLAHGVRHGDRVAVLCSPRPEAFVSFLAAARIGALWLGLNPRYQLPELAYVIGDSQPKLLLSMDVLDGRSYAADIKVLADNNPCIGSTVLIQCHADGGSSFDTWVSVSSLSVDDDILARERHAVKGTTPALLVYTSGSSGKPKGVLLRHQELIRRSRTQNERFGTRTYPKVINPLPINHIGGMHFLGLFAFIGGGTICYAERFSAEEFVDALKSEAINVLILLPTMFKMIADQPGFSPKLLSRLEWFVFSGAAMSPELVEMVKSSGCRVGLTYGMTETCGSVTYSDPDATVEVLSNTIGRAAPEGEVRVADAQGVAAPVDIAGELQVRAEFCMGGYLNREQATADAYTADGWLRTGDTAVMREDGNIRFVGRLSEMFKSGGYNVYPREVELALENHGSVILSAVVSVADPLFDEVGWAYVVPAPGKTVVDKDLQDWCRSQLANYKIPKRFIVCSELPLLPIGKVDKVALRKRAREACEV